MELYTGRRSDEVLDYLLKRRSAVEIDAGGPGPSAEELQTILTAGARVPDHGRAVPFYFLVFQGEAREKAGHIVAEVFQRQNAGADAGAVEEERQRFLAAPLVIGVVHRARKAKHPLWEQFMTAGAVCQNVLQAASALGYGAQWLSGWHSYDADVKVALGLDERDHIAGYIHIGTPADQPEERARPVLDQIVNHWEPGQALKKGDGYDQDKFGIPRPGFNFY